MNHRFGEFLYSLRKETGMTQAELAERLGVTNKAVSKWETGEAMPETSLLLPLAEIFGVTVDELLLGKRADGREEAKGEEEKREGAPAESSIPNPLNGHLFTRGKDDDPETALDKICGVVCAALVLGGIAAYLFMGAFADLWHPYWVIIPVCALACGIVGIVFKLCDREKREQKRAEGKNPYTDGACGIIMLSSIIAYLCLGAFGGLWHPYWIIMIAGMATVGIVGAAGTCFTAKKKKK